MSNFSCVKNRFYIIQSIRIFITQAYDRVINKMKEKSEKILGKLKSRIKKRDARVTSLSLSLRSP